MGIRWKKILIITAPIVLFGLFSVTYEKLNPDAFSDVACVRIYPDQRVEKDSGDSCYDPNLPEAIVLKRRQ